MNPGYWYKKKRNAKGKGIAYTLSKNDEQILTREALENKYVIGRSKGQYHLARIDHSKGYSIDNVKWDLAESNSGEVHNRYDLKKNLELGRLIPGVKNQAHRDKITATQSKNGHYVRMAESFARKTGGFVCNFCRRTKGRHGPCKNKTMERQYD